MRQPPDMVVKPPINTIYGGKWQLLYHTLLRAQVTGGLAGKREKVYPGERRANCRLFPIHQTMRRNRRVSLIG